MSELSIEESECTDKTDYKILYLNEKKNRQIIELFQKKRDFEIEKLKEKLESCNNQIALLKKNVISLKNSNTAKDGYAEEESLCNDLKKPEIKNAFIDILGNKYDSCLRVSGNHKCDIESENKILRAQVKKYKNGQFQQLDRHTLNHFIESIPKLGDVKKILSDLWEYPLLPNSLYVDKTNDIKKLCHSNYSPDILKDLLTVLNSNKRDILNYAFLGKNPEIQPEYLIGVEYKNNKKDSIVVFKIKDVIDYLETCDFRISPKKTALILGNENIISLQRKGGDRGYKSSNQLQIKIIVSKLIEKVYNIQHKL